MSQLRSIYKRTHSGDRVIPATPNWRETMDQELLIPVNEYEKLAEPPPRTSINDFSTEIRDTWRDQVKPEEIYNGTDPLHFANLSNTILMHQNPKVIFGDVHTGGIYDESGKMIEDEHWGIEDSDDLDLNVAAGHFFFEMFNRFARYKSIPTVEALIKIFERDLSSHVIMLTESNVFPVDNISFTSSLILQTRYNISKYEDYVKSRHEDREKSRYEDREKNQDLEDSEESIDPSLKRFKNILFYGSGGGKIEFNSDHLQLLYALLNAFNFFLEKYLRLDNEQEDLRAATSRFACYLLEIFHKFEVLATNDPIRLANLAILAWGQKRTMLKFETPDRHTLTGAVLREVEVIIQHYSINEAMVLQKRQDWIEPIYVPGRVVEDKFLEYTQKNLNTWVYIHTTLRALYG